MSRGSYLGFDVESKLDIDDSMNGDKLFAFFARGGWGWNRDWQGRDRGGSVWAGGVRCPASRFFVTLVRGTYRPSSAQA